MAPNLYGNSATLFLEASQNVKQNNTKKDKNENNDDLVTKKINIKPKYKWHIVWRNVVAFVYLHAGALYGLYLMFSGAKIQSSIFREYFPYLIIIITS